MTILKARKKPVEVHTVQWTGDNFDEILAFTHGKFVRTVTSEEGFTAKVFDYLHNEWIPVKTGDYIMEGVEGENYPCNADVFTKTYNVNDDGTTVFIVVVDDSHVGIDVYAFGTLEEATKFARETALTYADKAGDVREEVVSGLLYYVRYSPDSSVRVIAAALDAHQVK